MSEASPVDLRINYLWLMLLRTGVATSTNGRHSGCSALGPTREGSIKIHPERSIGAAIHHLERSELIETGRIETILRHMASYSHFHFQLQNLGMSFICLNGVQIKYLAPKGALYLALTGDSISSIHPLENSTTLLYPSGTRFLIHILGVTFTGLLINNFLVLVHMLDKF